MIKRKRDLNLAYKRLQVLAGVTKQVQKEHGFRYRTLYPWPPEFLREIMERFEKVDPYKKVSK
jgi:hypothetical protein